jgi:putative ABC transport system permease protein
MRILFWSHLQNARDSLRSNRGRSMLTMLGITIGVASVTAILALSGGASQTIGSQVDSLGGNIAIVRPGAQSSTDIERLSQFQSPQQFASSTLTTNDLNSIERIEGVSGVATLSLLSGAVSGDSIAPSGTPIVVTTAALEQVDQLRIQDGQFLDQRIVLPAAVIGPQLSIDIFGTEQSIGKTIQLRGEAFTVIGILKRSNTPINYNGIDFDRSVIISREDSELITASQPQIQQINIRSTSIETLDSVIVETNKTLLRNHLGEADFMVLSGDEIAQPTSQLFTVIAGVTAAIAAISLLVGGIGVMNIMLVNVAERTREIGIRKAVGASNGDIVSQFMIESLALSIGGGIAGYLVGYGVAFGLSFLLPFVPLFSLEIAALAAGVSLVVGVLFGIYPAYRAAQKDPISALRQYD